MSADGDLTAAPTTQVTRADIDAAAGRLAGRVRRTPTIHLVEGELGVPAPLTLKLELLQHSGSFKARGAFHRVLAEAERGRRPSALVAASGGNHGAAVAYV